MHIQDIEHVIHMDRIASIKWPHHYYIKSLTTHNYFALLAQISNKYVGNIMFRIDHTTLFIDKILVVNSFRQQGIGGALLENTIKIGKQKKANLTLLTVSYNNFQGMDFYRKHGFMYESIQWNHYSDGEHGVKMYRNI